MNIFFILGDKTTIWELFVDRLNREVNPASGQPLGQETVSVFQTVFEGATRPETTDPRSQATRTYFAEQAAQGHPVVLLGINYGTEADIGDIGNLVANAQMFRRAVDSPAPGTDDYDLLTGGRHERE
jgi:hypothetical protein